MNEEQDGVSVEWEWLKGVNIGAVGGEALRERCTRVLDAERNRIVLFGGKLHSRGSAIGSRCTPQALCLAYSLEEKSFEPLGTTGVQPPCLWGHSACLSGGLMYVFGGKDIKTDELNSTLYALDIETLRWSVPLFAGDSPSGRFGHSCACFEDQLFFHGGMCDDKKFLPDTFLLHISAKRWISLPCGPARAFHSTAMLGDTMLVYGGRNSQGTSRDVFLFDCLEGEWSLQQMFSSKSTTVPDRRESSCLVPFDNKVVVMCGSRMVEETNGTHFPIMLLSVDGDMLQWNTQATKGVAPTYGDASAFVVSDGSHFVILTIGDCGISFLATGVPIEAATSGSDFEDLTEAEKPAFKSMSAGQLGILGSFGLGRKKKKGDSGSLLKTEVKEIAAKSLAPGEDVGSLTMEELREHADKFMKANEYQFQREKPTKVSGRDLLLLKRLLEKERTANEEFVSGMEELRSVMDTCYDLSACAERQQRKLSRQGGMLEASLEHCRDDLAVFQTMTSSFIHDDSQRELANTHLKAVMEDLNGCMASVRYLCQTAELPRIGTLPSLFNSPRSPRQSLVGSGGFVAAPASVTVSPRSPRSPRSPKGSRLAPSSPSKNEWRRRSRSLLRSAKEVTTVEQAAEQHATPSRRSSDTIASRKADSGEWSPRKIAKATPPLSSRNPSPTGDPNGSKKELILSLSTIEDPHRRKEADALVRELGSEAPKLVAHTKQMFILEAHAAAAGEPSLQPEAKKNVPAVPPRAGRRSLQMKQEGYHIAGGDTRKIMSRASTKNMIEMCRALEAAEPSDQYNLVVTELVNTERQFVSDMLAVSMMFMKPLQEKLKGLISEGDFHAMFGNSTEVLEQSRKFLSQVALEAAKPPEAQDFGALFTGALESMFPEFLPYCTNLLLARRTKSRLTHTNSGFAKFLQDVAKDSRCEQQDLKSYLIKPLQRLCKYPLLLSEMRKHCGEHQKESLAMALQQVKAFVAEVNEQLLKDEDMEPLYVIQDSLYPSLSGAVPKVALQGRRLLASCQVLHLVTRKGSKKVRPRPCVLHLFSDIIILCEEVKGRHMLRLVLPVDGTNAEQVNEDAIPALKGRSVGFVLELSGAQTGSLYIACSDPTELASLRHSLAAARDQK